MTKIEANLTIPKKTVDLPFLTNVLRYFDKQFENNILKFKVKDVSNFYLFLRLIYLHYDILR